MKKKTVLIIAGFLIVGLGILCLPKYMAFYLTAPPYKAVSQDSLPKGKTLAEKNELEGPLFGVTASSIRAVKETSLHLSLLGTSPSSDSASSFAVILVNGDKQELVSSGADIVAGVSLYRVADDYVLISRNGAIEKLSYSNIGDDTDGSGRSYLVSTNNHVGDNEAETKKVNYHNILQKSSLVEKRSDGLLSPVKTFIHNRIIHHYESEYKKNPKVTLSNFGVKASPKGYVVGSGSLLLQANLKVGDVVMSVNGIPASQILGSSEAISKIRASGVAIMHVERNGTPVTISYKF